MRAPRGIYIFLSYRSNLVAWSGCGRGVPGRCALYAIGGGRASSSSREYGTSSVTKVDPHCPSRCTT
eukprot:1186475-Prorocentrum_minimum.AAC.3